jgi:UDP-N-acetyl-D-mannosaminuronic acid transferase (WecB/TagA/CpsF family)
MRAIDILGTPLTATTYDEFTQYCQELARVGGTSAVDLSNTQVVTMRRHEPEFRETTSRFDFFIPDGMTLIWCLNRKGADPGSTTGQNFMRHCILNSPASYKHYLLGGSPDCLGVVTRYGEGSSLQIVGSHHGYFSTAQ